MSTNADTNKGPLPRRTLRVNKPNLSLDHITTLRTPKSSAHSSVFARLQARLLPHASTPSPPATSNTIHPAIQKKPPPPSYLKIRIVTWNMNEALPKGDLAPLLGIVPPYQINASPKVDLDISGLTLDVDHPYHLVLVAGQECPTLMGLPLGLGGGMKWDKEREEEEKKNDKDDSKKKKEKMKDKDKEVSPLHPDPSPISTPGARTPSKHHLHHTAGWSGILEDYLARGISSIPGVKLDTVSPASSFPVLSLRSPDHGGSPASATTQGTVNNDTRWNWPPGGGEVPKTGPYELLTKERLMGIYLALYIHRDIKPLVEGCSQANVTAGLIGGRLGNKGGVAISLKIHGTTFLFLNAHLAAHEEKVALRIANLTKIKAELSIDDFLPPDDKRKLMEDPTDRFDHTFLFGDLNFRLDITRLHAEWLISHKKYADAQEFDQLRKIMRGPGTHAFSGFTEAPIDFAPTFKYDILHTVKGSKRFRKGNVRGRRPLSEVGEQGGDEAESSSLLPGDGNHEINGTADSESVVSSTYQSRTEEDRGSSSSEISSDSERDHSFVDLAKVVAAKIKKRKWYVAFKSPSALPPSPVIAVTQAEGLPRAGRGSVNKATATNEGTSSKEAGGCVSLSRDPSNQRRSHDGGWRDRSQTIVPSATVTRESASMDIPRKTAVDPIVMQDSLMRSISSKSAASSKTTLKEGNNEAGLGVEDMGVYDTSSKQRVPSWCDRILFKTTIYVPPPTPIESPPVLTSTQELPQRSPTVVRKTTPMIEFFQHAFRPKSRSGSSVTIGVNSASAATGEARTQPIAKTSSSGGVSAKRASYPRSNETHLQTVTNAPEETDSPVAMSRSLPTSPDADRLLSSGNKEANQIARRTTTPDAGRTGSGGKSSLRIHVTRRRSLSATLPRTSEPVGVNGRLILPSASMPPVLSPEHTPGLILKGGGPGSAKAKTGTTPGSGGGGAIRRVFSFFSGPFGIGQSPVTTAIPEDGQSVVVEDPPPRGFIRGEVQCLSYATLSDREMRRLEGRSDHRPVIGQFAVYL